MRSQKKLFVATAVIEVGAGLSLVSVPALAASLLLGVPSPSLEALIVGRVGGVGLLAIGVACWLARDDRGSRSRDGLLWGILIYDVGASAVLVYAGSVLATPGPGLWPGLVLHAVMAIWCAVVLRGIRPTAD